ncbi:MAG: Lrp/AsnC family transcriptional regulator [Promethearchaeia archaeon]
MSEFLVMDEIDKKIMNIIQNRPNITHTEIAKRVNRSQPTVGLRIKKLMEEGLLDFQAGINIKHFHNILIRVDLQTNKPENIFRFAEECPNVINAYQTSGLKNIELLMTGPDLKTLENLINHHFRKNKLVKRVSIKVITDVLNKFVIPLNLRDKKES